MTQTLDYHRPIEQPPSRVLAVFAHISAAYPLLLLGALYGQWLLSWWVLGHVPRPSLDDPMSIVGANWMHLITSFALLGFLPAGCGAAALNTLYAINRRLSAVRLLVRVVAVGALWAGTVVLLRWDPGRVLYWWFD